MVRQPTNISGSLTIPTSVTYKGTNYSVTRIVGDAFENCSSLTSITIPTGITSIGHFAFDHCNALTIYCETTSSPSGWSFIWTSCPVVWDCKNNDIATDGYIYSIINGVRYRLKDEVATVVRQPENISGSITIPTSVTYNGTNYNVTSIGDSAFSGCSGLIQTENGVKYVDKWVVGRDTSVTSVSLRENTVGIANIAFSDYNQFTITRIDYTGDIVSWCGMYGLNNLDKSKVYINGKRIADMTSITIPHSLTSIEKYALSGFSSITSITVESGNATYHSVGNCIIETATKTLIAGCKNSVIPTDGSVTSIGEGAFADCAGLTRITIPTGVTSIGDYAFYNCSSLTSITIPEGVTSIESNAFAGCSQLAIGCVVTSKPDGWASDWNKLDSSSSCSVVWDCNNDVPDMSVNTSVVVNGIKYKIQNGAATVDREQTNISGAITIRASIIYGGKTYKITGIGLDAFYHCTDLTSITIPNGVTSIGESAFAGCTGLAKISLPDSLTSIGSGAFYKCSSLTSVTIPSGVTHIGWEAFQGCVGLTSITLPDGITSLGDNVFSGCTGLITIEMSSNVTSIGSCAFFNCSSLKNIKFAGTKAQWAAIAKGNQWNYYSWNGSIGNYTVTCSDGTLTKAQSG